MAAPDLSTRGVAGTVYVRLLGEGTEVFRPVPALIFPDSQSVLQGQEIFDPEDENWEFLPGSIVRVPGSIVQVEERVLSGERVLVAVRKASS